MTDEGTTLEYAISDNKVNPVKEEQEIGEKVKKKIQAIHSGLFDFLADARELPTDVDPYVCLWPFMNLCIYPNSESIRIFEDWSFVDGVHRTSILPEHGLLFYVTHLRRMKQELEVNANKALWLKALMKLPLPYFDMLCFMTDRLGMKSRYQKDYFRNKKV